MALGQLCKCINMDMPDAMSNKFELLIVSKVFHINYRIRKWSVQNFRRIKMLQRHKRKLLIEEIRTRTAPLGHMTLLESMEMLKDALVKAEDAIVCITFTAKWCGPWRMIKPGNVIERL